MNNSNSTKSRSSLRDRFQAGDKPSQSDFSMIFDQTIHQQEDKIVAIKESGGVSLTIGENEKDKLLVKSAATFEKGLTTGSVTIDGNGQNKLLVKSDATFEKDLTASSVTIGEDTSGNLQVKSAATFKKGLNADSVTINGIGQGALLVKGGATFEKDLSIGSVAADGSGQGKLLVKNDAIFEKDLSADCVTINGIGQGALLVKGGATVEKDLTIGSLATDGSGQGKLLVKNDATFKKGLTASSVTIGESTSGHLLVKSNATFEKGLTTTESLTIGNVKINQVINTNLGSAAQADSTLATIHAVREYVSATAAGLTHYDNAEVNITVNLPTNDGANGYIGIPAADAKVENIQLKEGDIVLLSNQTIKTHNSLWKISTGAWVKQREPQTNDAVFIKQGAINSGTLWIMHSDDLANPQWVRRADLDYLQAGNGIKKEAQTLSLKTQANSGLICDATGLALNIQQLFVFLPEPASKPEIEAKFNAGAIFVGTYIKS
jgi:hypothetical protein